MTLDAFAPEQRRPSAHRRIRRIGPGKRRERPHLQRDDSAAVTLLRVDHDAGHGIGKPLDKQVDDYADQLAFFAWRLGIRTGERVGTVAAGR